MADTPVAVTGEVQERLVFGEKVVVIGGGILSSMALTAITPVLPLIEKSLAQNATDAMLVKQLFGFVSLAMVLGAPLGGFLVHRIGMRRMLLAAALIYTIAGTAGLYLSSLPLLLLSRLILGASAATIQVMSLTLVNVRLSGLDRARWMGLHVAVATLCSLAILPLSGVLGQISWRLPFAEYASGLVMFAALLRGKHDRGMPAASQSPGSGETDRTSIAGWFPWRYLPLSLLVGGVTFLPTVYTPYLLKESFGMAPAMIALVLTGGAVIGGSTALLYSKARRHLTVNAAFSLSFGLAAAGLLLASQVPPLAIMLLGLALHSLGVAWFVPNLMTGLGSKVTPAQQSRAAGLVKAAHFLSAPLCLFLVEPYTRQFGAQAALFATAVAAGAVVLVMLTRIATHSPSRPAAPA